MNFSYIKVVDFPKHVKRERILPWIRFGAFNPNNKSNIIYPIGLVDSGSDLSFINYEIGEELGYDIKSGKPIDVIGVGGGTIKVYLHSVGIKLLDTNDKNKPIIIQDYFGFSYSSFPSSMPQQTAILGTLGFFRNLNISFNFPYYISITNKPVSKTN